MEPTLSSKGLMAFPSAFWLEPHWRDTKQFSVEWLLEHARNRDIVLLVHPENVFAEPVLTADFKRIIQTLDSRVLS